MKPEEISSATLNSMTKVYYNRNSDIEIENDSDLNDDDMGRRPVPGLAVPASALLYMDIEEFKSALKHGY